MLTAVIAILPAVFLIPRVAAQATTNVTCSASSAWMQNKLGQNPCLVSAYLSSVCNSGTWFVPTLVAADVAYNPPEGTGANVCRCNTVLYSLIQACSTCQGSIAESWTDWITYCPTAYLGKTYPNAVPAQTVIPGWATLDPTATNMWNATLAQDYANSGGASANTKTKKSNVGAIVGGVVGGLVFLALVGFGIWFYIQRSSRGKGQKVTPAPYNDPGLGEPNYNNTGYVEKSDGHRADMGTPVPLMMMPPPTGPMKPYDPSDPSTFPQSPATTATYVNHNNTGGYKPYPGEAYSDAGSTPAPYSASYPPYQSGTPGPYPAGPQHQQQPGAYTGAAEV